MSLDPNNPELRIRIDSGDLSGAEFDQLCSAVRGLFHANGQSNGQTLKNQHFKAGRTVAFGAGTSKVAFAKSVRKIIRKSVRDLIDLSDG